MAGSDETTSDINPTPLDPAGWSLTTFDGFAGWYLDRALWPVVYDGPAANGAYTWSPADVILHGAGELLVRSINTESGWTAGGLGQGWNAQTYGRYEVRARADAGQGTAAVIGLWPADNSYPPEIDMLEAPTADRQVAYFTYHGETGGGETTGFPIDVTAWHVYALDWLPGKLIYYIDGVKVLERTADAPPAEPMTLNLTGFVGTPGDTFTRGGPDATTPWYVDLHVDWVRIWTPDSLMPGALPETQYGAPGVPEAVRTGVREIAGQRHAASWNAGEWGAVPDAAAAPAAWGADLATALLYANYATLHLDLHAAGGRALDLLAIGAKGGSLTTGRGGDHVTWVAHGEAAGAAANTMRILSRGGDDTVLVSAAGGSGLDQPFGYGSLWDDGYDGRFSVAVVGAGPGDDEIAAEEGRVQLRANGGAGADRIAGGDRRDAITGGPGDDLLSGGGGGDVFVLRQGDGLDRVLDFDTGADRLRLPAALSGSLRWTLGADGADWGTWVEYGDRGDQVFLRSVGDFSAADIVFA